MKGTFTTASFRALALAAGLAAAAPALAQEAEPGDARPAVREREDFERAREDGPRIDRRQDPPPRPEPQPESRPESRAAGSPAAPPVESRPDPRPQAEVWGRYGQPREARPVPAREDPGRGEPRSGEDRRDRERDRDRDRERSRDRDRKDWDFYEHDRRYGSGVDLYDGYRLYAYDGRRPPRYDPRWYPPVWNPPYRYRGGRWVPPPGFAYRRWAYGEVLPWTWWTPRYRIESWWAYGLPVPPIGYAWVRLGRDAVLVDLWTGRIVQVAFSLFW